MWTSVSINVGEMCVVCMDGSVFECERDSRLYAWCVWMGVCLNVREILDCVRGVCGWACV